MTKDKRDMKTKVKVKVKTKAKSPRATAEAQVRPNLSADRICNRCKVHDMIRSVKGMPSVT